MIMLRSIGIIALCSLLIVSAAVAANDHSLTRDPLAGIESDYQAGTISLDEKAELLVTAIFHPEQLPEPYALDAETSGPLVARCVTDVLIELKREWHRLGPDAQTAAQVFFDRPTRAYSFISPSGFFLLHFDSIGVNAVPLADNDTDGVPDFIENCAAYMDTSLNVHLAEGYLPPPSDGVEGGDGLYDVYFSNTAAYGWAMPEGDGPAAWGDKFSHLVMNNNFLGFPPNDDPEGIVAGAAKVTAAHEFHHAVQFGYDPGENLWYMELDATYFEEIVFDQINDNLNYLSYYMNFPQTTLMHNSGNHKYASFIWGMYLSQNFGSSQMLSVWEGARDLPTVYETMTDSLFINHAVQQDDAFADFCVWNYITGSRNDGLHHAEASAYPLVITAISHGNLPVGTTTSPVDPAGYASCYVEFDPNGYAGPLLVSFDGADATDWRAFVIASPTGNTHTVSQLFLDGEQAGQIQIEDIENYNRITLVGINVSEFSAADNFTYSAALVGPYAVTTQALMIDTAVYLSSERFWPFEINNPAVVGDVYDLITWDDSGWVTPDTTDVFIGSGGQLIYNVAVMPPAETGLGSHSTVHLKAVSRNAAEVADSSSAPAVAIMQYGDTNVDGIIDVADLTNVIGYLFMNGPDISPFLESGNFDCVGIIDVNDLTQLIGHLFIGGENAPCNEY